MNATERTFATPWKPTQTRRIHPVVLSGGTGTRLWPASRTSLPKQFLPLLGDRSLLQSALLRFSGREEFGAPLIVGANEHRFLLADEAERCGVKLAEIILEPVGRDTALAVAAAALRLSESDREAIMLVMPADHVIGNPEALAEHVAAAAAAAGAGWIVTFGVPPASAATGFGYVEVSDETVAEGVWKASAFVEKPEQSLAELVAGTGRHVWNSGMFLLRADVLLAELKRYAPDVLEAATMAVAGQSRDSHFTRLSADPLKDARSISIDYAVMQRSDRVCVMPLGDIGWADIGSWDALHAAAERDERGNAVIGEAVLLDSSNSLAYMADGRLLVGLGLSDLVVVSTPDALLISRRSMAQEVKSVVEGLRSERPQLTETNPHDRRVWGHFESLHGGDRHQVKHIYVKPGGRMSLQRHYHRSKHWVVVKGTARIVRGEEVFEITENESVYLPMGVRHRLENPGRIPLSLIEVQSGPYLGEDDIECLEDGCGRA